MNALRLMVPGLLERGRSRIMDGLKKFFAVDSHEAVKVGELHRVVRTRFTTAFWGAVIWEGADELTQREQEEGVLRTFIDTPNVGDKRWWSSLVDADWHAFCQAIFQGIEGSEWEAM